MCYNKNVEKGELMKKTHNNIKLDIMLPYGVALGAILGMLLAFMNDNVAYLVYGIIIGLFVGTAIGGYLFKKSKK